MELSNSYPLDRFVELSNSYPLDRNEIIIHRVIVSEHVARMKFDTRLDYQLFGDVLETV